MKMQRGLVLMCAAVLLVSSVAGQEPTTREWKVYVVNGGELSVALPSEPVVEPGKRFVERRQEQREEWTLKSSANWIVYTVYVVDNPEPRQSLAAFIEEQNASRAWDLRSERDVAIEGFISKTYLREGDAKGMIQFIRTNERLYYFRALGAPADDPRLTKFFSSIALAKKSGIDVSAPTSSSLKPRFNNGEKVFIGIEVDKKVRIKNRPEPCYPEAAKDKGVRGTVVLKAIFTSTGKVTNIVVVHGLPYGLTECAIEAAKKMKFTPAMREGIPVSVWMQLEYNFNLY